MVNYIDFVITNCAYQDEVSKASSYAIIQPANEVYIAKEELLKRHYIVFHCVPSPDTDASIAIAKSILKSKVVLYTDSQIFLVRCTLSTFDIARMTQDKNLRDEVAVDGL